MTARKAQPQIQPPQRQPDDFQPDVVTEFLNLVRQRRVAAHHEHERLRKQADDAQTRHDRLQARREHEEAKRRQDYDRETDELTAQLGPDLADSRSAAMKLADVIARCALAAELDPPRDPPTLTRREEG